MSKNKLDKLKNDHFSSKLYKQQKRIRKHFVYFLILITFIISLVYYGLYFENEKKVLDFFYLNDGSKESGYKRTVMGAYAGEFENSLPGFYIRHNTEKIPVFYLSGYFANPSNRYVPPRYGEAAVYGFITDEAIYALSIHNHDYNYVLYLLSFFAGIFVIAFFSREWKITGRGFKSA